MFFGLINEKVRFIENYLRRLAKWESGDQLSRSKSKQLYNKKGTNLVPVFIIA